MNGLPASGREFLKLTGAAAGVYCCGPSINVSKPEFVCVKTKTPSRKRRITYFTLRQVQSKSGTTGSFPELHMTVDFQGLAAIQGRSAGQR